ncbi:MAG: pimeloyl-ACP methyl ester carboxylesterase [Oceanicoccus sp.]|jgi:pimeloyl-ACP methyl ester carboxylesterase
MDEFERYYFNNLQCQLSFVDFGNTTAPDLLLLHGMRDHAVSMIDIARALSSHYHVVALDLRGHGQSDNPGIYTMVQFVADVRALVQHCELKTPIVIGHSLGGHIAARYTAIFQEDVSKLVLLDGMGPPMSNDNDREQQKTHLKFGIHTVSNLTSEGRQMKDEGEALLRLRKNNPKLSVELANNIIEHGIKTHSQGGVSWCFDPSVQMIWHTFSHEETEELWSWIECPVLIVTGEYALDYWSNMRDSLKGQQDFYAQTLRKRQQIFKNARHHVIKDAGHMLHYDQPEPLNELLREFLCA